MITGDVREAFAQRYVDGLCNVLRRLPLANLSLVLGELEGALAERRQVFLAGNGGSAATALHMANDLAKGVAVGDEPGLRAVALTTNVSAITAIANDESYADVFGRQLAALGRQGDVLIVFSASGNSINIVRALEVARRMRMTTVAFLGMEGGRAAEVADTSIVVPSNEYGPIEDAHLALNHLITAYLRTHRRSAEGQWGDGH